MKQVSLVLVALLLHAAPSPGRSTSGFSFVSPRPGAEFVPTGTTIILRPETPPVAGVGAFATIRVNGSVSGTHPGEWIVAERGNTFLYRPSEPFAPGETVSVTVPSGPGSRDDVSFHFTVAAKRTHFEPRWNTSCPARQASGDASAPADAGAAPGEPEARAGLVLPTGFPGLTVTTSDNPAPGYVFMAPRLTSNAPPHYAVMLDSTGAPAFFRELPSRPHPCPTAFTRIRR